MHRSYGAASRPMSVTGADVIVIGAGIAGSAIAAELSRDVRVVILERESQPGYHTTGRSAALFSETYGNDSIRALSRASHSFFFDPTTGFTDAPLIHKRGAMFIARSDQLAKVAAFAALPSVARIVKQLSRKDACVLCPVLRKSYVSTALYEPTACDLDVHALLFGYLRQVRKAGSKLINNAPVNDLTYADGVWHVRTSIGDFTAPIVVNAAGAWVDCIAALAGAKPINIQPLRRTAAIVDGPNGSDVSTWPTTLDIDEQFYFKPDAGNILLSPADETPSVPCDAMPEDLDVAVAVDRVEASTTLQIKHVRHKWAGLRCFVSDRSPVVGYDPIVPGFFWVAALGGYGIQTAPAMGRLAASILLKRGVPEDLRDNGFDSSSMAPARVSR